MPSSSDREVARPRRLTHVSLFVRDLAASAAFYERVCGIAMVFDEPGIKAKFLSNGNSHHDIALMQSSNEQLVGRDGQVQKSSARGARPGLNHLGFEMHTEAELIRAIERVEAAGVRIARMLDHQISHSAYFTDPDGIDIELYADTTPDWRAVYRAAEGHLLSAQWQPTGPGDDEPRYVIDFEFLPPPDARVAPLRTERAMIVVRDLATSLAFYDDVVGLTATDVDLGGGSAVLRGSDGGAHVFVVEARDGEAPGFRGFGLRLRDDEALGDVASALRADGVAASIVEGSTFDGAVEVVDPDGVVVQLITALPQRTAVEVDA
jgi:catechol 2,3-dioxygenase